MDRKRYSKRREEAIWSAVDGELTKLRIRVLRGLLAGHCAQTQEERILKEIGSLPDKVAAEYRKRLDIKEA